MSIEIALTSPPYRAACRAELALVDTLLELAYAGRPHAAVIAKLRRYPDGSPVSPAPPTPR